MTSVDDVFLQVKSYLLQADAEGNSAYDHLEKIVLNILEENPNDIANHPEKLSELSSLIKKFSFANGSAANSSNNPAPLHSTRLEQLLSNKNLFVKPPPETVTTIEQPTPFTTVTTTTIKPPVAPAFSSVVSQNTYWRYCGIGLPEQEAFLLEQSISRLAMSKKLQEVRFFGKIFGTKGNYLVVTSKRYVGEGEKVYQEVNTMPKPPRKKVEVDMQAEPGYKGLNRVSFWVASNPAGEWTLLPDVTPQQVLAARRVKKLFTGDLNAPVVCSPAFDGNEAVYLRAQLSRIFSSTYIAPNGALEKVEPEEEEAEEDEEEGKKKGPKEAKYVPATRVAKEYAPDEEAGVHALLDLEQWVHSEGHIFENGRQTKVPEKPEVEGEEEEPKEEEEEEPQEEEEKKEEEEKELFLPVKKDYLYAVINLPKEPTGEEGEEEAQEEEGEEGEKEEEEENKPLDDEEIPDDDPLKKKVAAWTAKAVNATFKKHSVAVVKSLRWPGAVAFAANGAKVWGSIYFGNGMKKTDNAFTPVPAPQIQKESPDILEVMDATAATEKLVLRGEEPKENDSEDEKEEEEPEEEA